MIDHGRVIAEGTPGQLKASVGSGALHVRLLEPGPARRGRADPRRASSARVQLEPDPSALTAPVRRTPSAARMAVAALAQRQHRPGRLHARPAEPGRGLPGADRPPRRGHHDRRGGDGMSVDADVHRPGGDPQRALLHPAPAARERHQRRDRLRLARDAEGPPRARAAAGRDDHAGDVRPDVHLPVRRCHQRLDRRVPGLHPPRHPRDVRCCSRPSTPASRSTRT